MAKTNKKPLICNVRSANYNVSSIKQKQKTNKKNNLAFHCFEVKSNWKLPSWKKIVKTPPAHVQIYSTTLLGAANLKE